MILRDIIAAKIAVEQKLENYRGAASTRDHLFQIDEALKILASKARFFDPQITFIPAASTAEYRFSQRAVFGRRILKPWTVYINGTPLRNCAGSGYGLWSLQELTSLNPRWQMATPGQPVAAAWYSGSKLRLHPAPTEEAIGEAASWISAEIIPGYWKADDSYAWDWADLLVGDAEEPAGLGGPEDTGASAFDLEAEPDIHEILHFALAQLAAIKASAPMASGEEAWQRLTALNGEVESLVDEIRREMSSSLTSWGSVQSVKRFPRWVGL